MKPLFFSCIAGLVLASCTINTADLHKKLKHSTIVKSSGKEEIEANSPMETKTFRVGKINSITASLAMEYIIQKGDEDRVEITSNALKYIDVSNHGTLSVGYTHSGKFENVNTKVVVYVQNFESLTVMSAASILVKDEFYQKNLKLDLNSAGIIKGNFYAEHLDIDASSASLLEATIKSKKVNIDASSTSKIKLSGSTEKVKAEATTLAKINLEHLEYNNIDAKSSTFGKVLTP